MRRILSGRGAAAALILGLLAIPAAPRAAAMEQAALSGTVEATASSASLDVLSAADERRYAQIFELQEDGRWKQADALIAELEDDVLMGHVLFQRYMHPTAYRSKYAELKDWMAKYADHPGASRVHRLALQRRPGNWKYPARPARIEVPGGIAERASVKRIERLPEKAGAARRAGNRVQYQIRRALRRGHTLTAKRLLQTREAERYLSAAEYDEASAALGKQYFFDGRHDFAEQWAGRAAKRSGALLPDAHWTLGLLAWREGEPLAAARHFEAAASGPRADEWIEAQAAFWAARGYLKGGQPDKVNALLERAARRSYTFYGLLAAHILGREMPFNWRGPLADQEVADRMQAFPATRRAAALIEVGESGRAAAEIRPFAASAERPFALGLLGLASRGGLATLALALDRRLYPEGGGYDGARFPVPAFVPDDGFTVDRALVYALIRQESRFNPKAKSWAGARGLMQLMPGTARFVASMNNIRWHGYGKLYTPATNLMLGQRYISMLIEDDNVGADLFLLTAAWNGGPGNLSKWRRRTAYEDDPLYFIETIPNRETRDFVEKVLTNFWVYRHQLDQDVPSLDAIARGKWPVYTALGNGSPEVAVNDER